MSYFNLIFCRLLVPESRLRLRRFFAMTGNLNFLATDSYNFHK